MEALAQLLDDARTRLLTLTGPPGIGKTRLAVAAAAAHAEATGRSAAFVDLVPVRDPNMVIVELARALDVDGRDRTDLVDQMAAAVAAQDRVVVLDNCEHLLAAAPSLGRVLAACQGLRVLATSREPLRLSAEQEFPVPPLPMPAVGDVTDLVAVAANPSVALLVDRARRVHPRFALTEHNAASVVAACVRLEGLPLALELAAARLKLLSPGELAFRLGHRMELLASRSCDVPARHRALRSAITWSHELLDSAERVLFRRLSVFVGGWTLVDVERVCAAPTDDVLAVVGSLLDKNMIRRVSRDDETAEFSMLESLREYAAEQLVLRGEAEQIRARHAAHYTELAIQFEATHGLPEERTSWLPIARHHANLRAALEHCLAEGRHGPALQLATALGWYCYTRGDLREGQALVDQVLILTAEQDMAGDTSAAGAWVGALIVAGLLAWSKGQLDRAESLLQRGLELSERMDDVRHSTVARAFLGHVARARGRYDESAEWHHQAAAGFQRLGNAQGEAWTRQDLGLLARDRGDLDEAVALFRASLRDFQDLAYPWAAAWSAWGLGSTLCAQGRVDEASPVLGEALRIYEDLDDPRGAVQCLEALAEVACERALYETAARLIGFAAAQRQRLAAPLPDADRARIATVEVRLTRSLGPDAAERIRQAGRAMPLRQAAKLAAAVAAGTVPSDPDRGRPALLTRRERQVTALVATGRTNRQIGRALGIAEKTAEIHLQHVMAKLHASSRAEVAAWAVSHRLDDSAV
jgi:predicted ATPase/DNA-binding CsgD family transcriptional regulator